jgi:uncharacterized protein YcbX
MNSIVVSGIYIYPIKSLGGISLPSSLIEERGFQYDHRWMLVDAHNHFLTQRKFPKMALLKVSLSENGLQVTAPAMPSLFIPFVALTNEHVKVTIWDDTCTAIVVSQQINEWFSEALEMKCKLVFMPDDSIRPVDNRYAKNNEFVSFADGYPFLLIGEASLADLNSRLASPVPMNRFRPSLVVTTTAPFEEDRWRSIRIGNNIFHLVKPCARCILTTVDQQTGIPGKEPLKTLASYRTINNKVLFGQNVLCEQAGNIISVGEKVELLKTDG